MLQRQASMKRQVASLQQTPGGDFAVVMIESDEPGSFFKVMGEANDGLATWFKA